MFLKKAKDLAASGMLGALSLSPLALMGCDRSEHSGCLPLVPDLTINTFEAQGLGEGNAQSFMAFISSSENRCKEIEELSKIMDGEPSGGCLLPDGSILTFTAGILQTRGSGVEENVEHLVVRQVWTLHSAPKKPEGHRDEVCQEEIVQTFELR